MNERTVLTADGDICQVGDVCAHRLGLSKESLQGKSLKDLYPSQFVEEFLPLLQRHAQERTPFLASLLLRGVWSVLYLTPCTCPCGDDHLAFECFSEQDWRSLHHELYGVAFYKLQFRDAGWLSSLTLRELEILKLIGDGLTTKQMSQLLHRSERTVQGHRISLGKKLNCATKADLARVATDAGLPSVPMEELSGFMHHTLAGRN